MSRADIGTRCCARPDFVRGFDDSIHGERRPHFDEIFESHRGVEFLEIIAENFMDFGGRARAVLERAIERGTAV